MTTLDERSVDTDLGFGSVVARESRQRLLNRDGTFNVRREGLRFWESLSAYHYLLTISWPKFFGFVIAGFLATNAFFATLYMLAGEGALNGTHADTIPGRFLEEFFFSVHTLATIGYGTIAPATLLANVIVTIETLVGLVSVAVMAGISFARFSRPVVNVLFSRNAVIAPYRGGRAHPIDADSPLRDWDWDVTRCDAEFLILLNGFDDTFSQTVHTRSSYKADEVVWGARFTSMFQPKDERGTISVDIRKLHDIERVSV